MGPVIWLPKVAHAALQILPAMAMHEVHAVHLGHAAHPQATILSWARQLEDTWNAQLEDN